jgi:hypothetical protein
MDFKCDFCGILPSVLCQNKKYWNFEGTFLFKDCHSDVTSHLKSVGVSTNAILVLNEKLLILNRAFGSIGYIYDHGKFDSWVICAAHRFHLGVGFKKQDLCKPCKVAKLDKKASSSLSINSAIKIINIRKCVNSNQQFFPIGTGLCNAHRDSISLLEFEENSDLGRKLIQENKNTNTGKF